jgi:hypothetical protein
VGVAGEEERGDVGVRRPAGLDVAVVPGIDGVAQQGPPVAVGIPGVEKVSEPGLVLLLAGE